MNVLWEKEVNNHMLDTSQWDEPPAESRVWCTRFMLSLSLIAESPEQRCSVRQRAMFLPPTLNVPGRLDGVNGQVRCLSVACASVL